MTVITVTNNSDYGSGTLRQAVLDAQSGDTIKFDASLSNQTITLSSGLWLNKSFAIFFKPTDMCSQLHCQPNPQILIDNRNENNLHST